MITMFKVLHALIWSSIKTAKYPGLVVSTVKSLAESNFEHNTNVKKPILGKLGHNIYSTNELLDSTDNKYYINRSNGVDELMVMIEGDGGLYEAVVESEYGLTIKLVAMRAGSMVALPRYRVATKNNGCVYNVPETHSFLLGENVTILSALGFISKVLGEGSNPVIRWMLTQYIELVKVIYIKRCGVITAE